MSEERGESYYTAQEAKRMAESANDLAKAVSGHLGTISQGIEAMRLENSTQHRENAKVFNDGMVQLHARVSSIKKAQDDDRQGILAQFADVEKNVSNARDELKDKIISVRDEALKGDIEIKEKGSSTAIKVLLAVLGGAGSVIAALIATLAATGKIHIG